MYFLINQYFTEKIDVESIEKSISFAFAVPTTLDEAIFISIPFNSNFLIMFGFDSSYISIIDNFINGCIQLFLIVFVSEIIFPAEEALILEDCMENIFTIVLKTINVNITRRTSKVSLIGFILDFLKFLITTDDT